MLPSFGLKSASRVLSRPSVRRYTKDAFQGDAAGKKYEIVFMRHGESTWNLENKFTGWYDCPLSAKGHLEAEAAGNLLKQSDFKFDIAYTSMLKRAVRTLWHTLEATDCMTIPIVNAWELNERHYGALQGLDKKATVEKYGEKQVLIWRRSYDIPPPPCEDSSPHSPSNDEKYKNNPAACKIRTESLATTLARVVPYWEKVIVPQLKVSFLIIILFRFSLNPRRLFIITCNSLNICTFHSILYLYMHIHNSILFLFNNTILGGQANCNCGPWQLVEGAREAPR